MLLRSIETKKVCIEFLEELKKSGKKASTRANYHQKIHKYILPSLPAKATKIRKSHCDELVNTLQKSLCHKSVNDIIILLNSIFSFAYEKRYMRKFIKIEKLKDTRIDDIEIFTDREQEILVDYILSHLDYFNFGVLITLTTGLRIGELSALTQENICSDFVQVEHTLQRIKNIDSNEKTSKTIIILSHPKSEKSKRKIPLDDIVIDIKKRLTYHNDAYIVTGGNYYMEPRTIERKYKKLLNDCDIKYRKFHTLRHTFAMNCVCSGMKTEMLAELMGHSNTKVTAKYYIHYALEYKRKMIKKASITNKINYTY